MYHPIEDQEMIKIRTYMYFNRSSGKILQEEIAFNTLYYFGLRGRETLRFLEKDSFIIESDSEDREFIRLVGDRLSKNCKASLKPADFENAKKVRCYAIPEKSDECPVACLKQYLIQIPENVTFSRCQSSLQMLLNVNTGILIKNALERIHCVT